MIYTAMLHAAAAICLDLHTKVIYHGLTQGRKLFKLERAVFILIEHIYQMVECRALDLEHCGVFLMLLTRLIENLLQMHVVQV